MPSSAKMFVLENLAVVSTTSKNLLIPLDTLFTDFTLTILDVFAKGYVL